ncbi:MAG TPA: SwmB domain-containing protein [bacterium]|nr:SwmB domain-containing protein [bacterium]
MKYKKHLFAMAIGLVGLAIAGTFFTRKSAESAVTYNISVGSFPQYTAKIGQNVYTANRFGSSVSVIDATTRTAGSNISVGTTPVQPIEVGTDLYVTNSGAGTVSVINSLTNTVSNTITIGATWQPWGGILVGTDLYIGNNASSSVSIIDTVTKTVSGHISVPASGSIRSFGLVGTKLYVTNYNSNSVTVIDTITKTVITTIPVGTRPFTIVVAGTSVYVANQNSANVSVIDSTLDVLDTTIPVASGAYELALVGTDLYVSTFGSTNIAVIDTLTNTVADTIPVAGNVLKIIIVGTNAYALLYTMDSVAVIDTLTKTVTTTVAVGDLPYDAEFVGDLLFISNANSNNVSVLDMNTNTLVEVGKPLRVSASISNTELTIVFDEPLDPASVPDPSQFTVRYTGIIGPAIPVNSVSVIGSNVVLEMASAPSVLSDVRVGYTHPVTNPLQDLSQNTVTTFTNYTASVISCAAVAVGYSPRFSLAVGGDLYVLNDGSGSVSVVDIGTSAVIDTIAVGSQGMLFWRGRVSISSIRILTRSWLSIH